MWRWIKQVAPWLMLYAVVGLGAFITKQGILYDDDCWSPNHEYFLVRKQTLLSFMIDRRSDAEGWMLFYDKYGNLVHRWDGDLRTDGGPWWHGNSVVILNQPQAQLRLPSDAGEAEFGRVCH